MTRPKVTARDMELAAARIAARDGLTVTEVRQNVRDVTTAYAEDPTRCDHCETELSQDAVTNGRRDCGQAACRQATSRARKAES